jgi:tetratricopeptide (TPR) repeat protein
MAGLTSTFTPPAPLTLRDAIEGAAGLCNTGRWQEAEQLCRGILRIKPGDEHALHILGVCSARRGSHEEAVALFEQSIEANPAGYQAWLYHGISMQALSRHTEALESYDKAIAIKPDLAEAYSNRGNTLQILRRHAEAIADYDRAIAINERFAEAYANRATALYDLNRHEDALQSCDVAVSIRPGYAEAHATRAYALLALNRHRDAIEACDRAIAANPEYAQAKYMKANALLAFGISQEAWQLYEGRLGSNAYSRLPTFGIPSLGGESAHGKRVLVQWEQRYGDVIQMLRFAPRLQAMAAQVWWQLDDPLGQLVLRSFPSLQHVGTHECPPEAEYRVPYTSLPLALGIFSEAALSAQIPYLSSDEERVARAREELRSTSKSRTVGIVWRGNAEPQNRSIPIERLTSLFDVGDVRFVDLQGDPTGDEKRILQRFANVTSRGEGLRSFDDTAAIVAAVDLVITVDTAIAHLAGALGKPVWILLKSGADWRWLLDRSDSPWYPTARLFRQSTLGDWDSVLRDVKARLDKSSHAA